MCGIHSLICFSTILCDSTRRLIPLKNHQSKTSKTSNKGSDLNQSNEVVRNLVLGFVHHGITLKNTNQSSLFSLLPPRHSFSCLQGILSPNRTRYFRSIPSLRLQRSSIGVRM